ncbi:beta-glucosidase [Silvibacterium acidisoli]|uniref:beta-glucosidase n=1 Tax=Acidobacteriaceae bacterium ZG23-2 TaxID=2883246 RepID=UPI00406D2F59
MRSLQQQIWKHSRRAPAPALALTMLATSWMPAPATALGAAKPDRAVAVPEAQARARAEALVRHMSLEEKVGQMHGFRDRDHFREVPAIPRLGIPELRVTNGPAGVGPGDAGVQAKATALPAPIALAATWDPEAAYAYGQLAGEETRVVGENLLESPDVNIVRVPQGGRTFESFSEDPWLAARMAVGEIRGIQSAGVMANVKHYLANNQETGRSSIDEIIDERTLHEIYLPAFRASVEEAGVDSVMCAYPRVNGAYNCENPRTLGILRGEWKFRGFVMSDFGAVHSTQPSLEAGLDLEMPTGKYFGDTLLAAVKSGQIAEGLLDQALVRRYTVMIERGLFARRPAPPAPIPAFEHGAEARKISEESMVLLKNEGGLLPLDEREHGRIALIGPDAVRAMVGGGGSSYVNPLYTVRPEDGIYSHLESQAHLEVLDGSDIDAAVKAARRAKVAIVMVGDDEGEDHDHALALPGNEDALIRAVAAANPHTIVVVKSGSAVLMPWLDQVPAVLEAWYPGEEDGNAVADVLFGQSDPGGRLPISFPRRTEDTLARDRSLYPGENGEVHYGEGLMAGYRGYQAGNIEPLFPFGFGLSYTSFRFSGLSAKPTGIGEKRTVELRFQVTNTGLRAGSTVAQVYVGFPPIAEGNEPPLQLKGFAKVRLAAGASESIALTLPAEAFAYWSPQSGGWKQAQGQFSILLGSSSADLPERAAVMLR